MALMLTQVYAVKVVISFSAILATLARLRLPAARSPRALHHAGVRLGARALLTRRAPGRLPIDTGDRAWDPARVRVSYHWLWLVPRVAARSR